MHAERELRQRILGFSVPGMTLKGIGALPHQDFRLSSGMELVCRSGLACALLAAFLLHAQAGDLKGAGSAVQTTGRTTIAGTEFGSITIAGKRYDHDVIIRLDGKVEKRKKALSKKTSGTSHILSLEEAKFLYQEGAQRLIIGSGQSGMVKLSAEAAEYFKQKGCAVELAPTPTAIRAWNKAQGAVIGMFHVTC
jgi:hypothetical protein